MCLNSSYSDFYLHNIDIMTSEFGADGVYLDGTIQERICHRGDIHGPECVNTGRCSSRANTSRSCVTSCNGIAATRPVGTHVR